MTPRKLWIVGTAGAALVLCHAMPDVRAQERPAPSQAPRQERMQAPPSPQEPGAVQERGAEERGAAEGQVDPRASAVVRRMADHLVSLRAFEVTADSVTEVVLHDGQKVQDLARSEVVIQRPNKLRSERRGALAHVTLLYDGDQMMMRSHRDNTYAQADAPNDLDGALDFARDRLGVEAPAADLLYTDAYEGLMQGVRSGVYLGQAEVRGVLCDHVAFRGEGADWQLWVERGARPLPRRFTIVTTDQEARPQFVVELHDWNVSPSLSASAFDIVPPADARRVEFGRVLESAVAAARREDGPREEGAGA